MYVKRVDLASRHHQWRNLHQWHHLAIKAVQQDGLDMEITVLG